MHHYIASKHKRIHMNIELDFFKYVTCFKHEFECAIWSPERIIKIYPHGQIGYLLCATCTNLGLRGSCSLVCRCRDLRHGKAQ